MSGKTLNPLQFVSFFLLWMISRALSVLAWLTLRAAMLLKVKGVVKKRFGLVTTIQVGILVISRGIIWITASMV